MLENYHVNPLYEYMFVVTPIDRPKSTSNRCVIEGFVDVSCLPFFDDMGAFVTGLGQISSLFSLIKCNTQILLAFNIY